MAKALKADTEAEAGRLAMVVRVESIPLADGTDRMEEVDLRV